MTVAFNKSNSNSSRYFPLEAHISKISRTGRVFIDFNQPLKLISNITLINTEALSLLVKGREPQFTWKALSVTNTEVVLQVDFANPYNVSNPV